MKSSGRKAASMMRSWSFEGKQGVKGFCLRTCRQAWDLPGDEPSAIAEWNSIPQKHRDTRWYMAPIGAPHFWEIGEFGHIALQSSTFGFVWSTDAPVPDRIGLVSVEWIEKHWKAKYLGWATQLQNEDLTLKLKEMPRVHRTG